MRARPRWVRLILLLGVVGAAGCTAVNDFGRFEFESCPDGRTTCDGSCVDTSTDSAHCGGCGMACGAMEVCEAGVCTGCAATVCDGACVDLQTDAANCGACGMACGADEACDGGSCVPSSCDPGLTVCDGGCVDTSSSLDHCGGCGNACDGDTEECVDGSCTPLCEEGLTACDGSCVDTTMDPEHCGECGNACAAADECVRSECLPQVREWRFVTCGARGRNGPDQTACDDTYAGGPLDGEVTVAAGIQQWTVPATGVYRIEARGAQGVSAQAGRRGGDGAVVTGTFDLTEGEVLSILVGQRGTAPRSSGGG
ncbi:MAG TPA: glycine-rich protein, partial [Sandaracinaceae bacterium LLY-WYZ-13_1]|nr:glycine-rich protein [Sandaracinaceae bacterium LLY-WYZ-13_1]